MALSLATLFLWLLVTLASTTFPADPHYFITERTPQWVVQGVPLTVIEYVDARVDDLWRDGPGGWPFEWSAAAEEAEASGNFLEASLIYSAAKFPSLGNAAHRQAQDHQLATYLKASAQFPQRFERRLESINYRGATTLVPVHCLSEPGLTADAPVLLYMGGADTWKMDVHHTAVGFSRAVGAHLVLVDMPGTGESQVKLTPDADTILLEVIERVRRRGNGHVAFVGFSFGGLWAAKLALTGSVDAAIAVGAPVDVAFEQHRDDWFPHGMDGIIANDLGLDALPDRPTLAALLRPFSLREQGLTNWQQKGSETPLLVANSDQDPYIPVRMHSLLTDQYRIRLVPDAGHCAAEKIGELIPWMVSWLKEQLAARAVRH